MQIILVILLAFWSIIGLIVLAAIAMKNATIQGGQNPQQQRWEKLGDNILKCFKFPLFFVVVSIALVNWLIYAINSTFWHFVWQDSARFWALNLSIAGALFLLLIKIDSNKTHPLALAAARVIGVLAGLVFAICLFNFNGGVGGVKTKISYWFGDGVTKRNIVVHRPTSIDDLAKKVPVEIAMEVVGYCESRNQHFETDKDGKIVLDANGKGIPRRNKGIPQRGIPSSDAFGKYSYKEFHRKLAADLGFDLDVEADQDWYFRYLYAKEGFGPWDHDEEYGGGRACWLPRLEALGFSLGSPDNPTMVIKVNFVEAPVAEWSEPFPIPVGFNCLTDWVDKKKKGRYKERYTTSIGTLERQFPSRSPGIERISGDVTAIEVMSLEEEPIAISFVLTPK